jgi:polygalacturonase
MKYCFYFLLLFSTITTSQAQVFNIEDFGAVANSGKLNTTFIQAAIDSAEKIGGATVLIPKGVFISSTIFLKDNITLEIALGGTLKGAPKTNQYPEVKTTTIRSFGDTYPQRSLIFAEGKHNITLKGEGTIDGNGLSADFLINKDDKPFGIRFISCSNVLYEGLTMKNSGFWMMHNLNCDSVTFRNIQINNHSFGNNDGISMDGCRNVLVENCNVDSNNDPLVIKTMSIDAIAENIEVRNCKFATYSRAIKVGSETFAAVKNVYVHDCEVNYSKKGPLGANFPGNCGILLSIVDGGSLDNVKIENIKIEGVNTPILIRLGDRAKQYSDTIPPLPAGSLQNILLQNLQIVAATNITSSITGIPDHLLKNIQLKNIDIEIPGAGKVLDPSFIVPENISGKPEHDMFGNDLPSYGLFVRHVDGLDIENVCISTKKPDLRPELYFEDTSNVNIKECGLVTSIKSSSYIGTKLYPNPSSDILHIQLDQEIKDATFSILDLNGRMIKRFELQGKDFSLDLKNIIEGFYLIQISNASGILSAGKFYKR